MSGFGILIMDGCIQQALIIGTERLAAWADLLDSINVFPVADADTGRNLVVSLSPLQHIGTVPDDIARRLLFAACGNSGNIAACFLSEFLQFTRISDMHQSARSGRDAAWNSVADPRPGTMLTIFDALVDILAIENPMESDAWSRVIDHLESAVRRTPDLLPALKNAGVVDAGALGMFIFFEGFFGRLFDPDRPFIPVTERFGNQLRIIHDVDSKTHPGHCVNAVIRLNPEQKEAVPPSVEWGESVVVTRDQTYVKIHLHTADRDAVRKKIDSVGQLINWSDEDMDVESLSFKPSGHGAIHIMTDAAGSIPRSLARQLEITLLDSYIVADGLSLPETHFPPSDLYRIMNDGGKVSTAQASVFQRHQHYQSVLSRFERVIYLCVGSIYTGNYQVATQWKAENDPEDRLTVIDTGAASGRLGTIVLATIRFMSGHNDPEDVIRFAQHVPDHCEGFVFLDQLRFLAAGGRLSRTGAFWGDLLHVKPVISPTAQGARKVGTVRDQPAQLRFAITKIDRASRTGRLPLILLEYSNNLEWVQTVAQPVVHACCPDSEIVLHPLSLTSGVHMGPGTWGIAYQKEVGKENI